MPFDLTKAAAVVVPLTVPIDDQEIKLKYRPNALTPKQQAALDDLPMRELYKILVLVISEWDIVLKGKPLPLTEKAMEEHLPSRIAQEILIACVRDQSPNEPSRPGSNSTDSTGRAGRGQAYLDTIP